MNLKSYEFQFSHMCRMRRRPYSGYGVRGEISILAYVQNATH